MRIFEVGLSRVEDALHVLGCVALLLIALFINADVLSRVVAATPLQFQFEAIEIYLMPMVATLSLARVFREGGHLALEIIPPYAFGKYWLGVRGIILLLSAAFFTAVTIMSGSAAVKSLVEGKVYFGIIDWPLGLAYLSVPVGCFVLTVRLLFEITKTEA